MHKKWFALLFTTLLSGCSPVGIFGFLVMQPETVHQVFTTPEYTGKTVKANRLAVVASLDNVKVFNRKEIKDEFEDMKGSARKRLFDHLRPLLKSELVKTGVSQIAEFYEPDYQLRSDKLFYLTPDNEKPILSSERRKFSNFSTPGLVRSRRDGHWEIFVPYPKTDTILTFGDQTPDFVLLVGQIMSWTYEVNSGGGNGPTYKFRALELDFALWDNVHAKLVAYGSTSVGIQLGNSGFILAMFFQSEPWKNLVSKLVEESFRGTLIAETN